MLGEQQGLLRGIGFNTDLLFPGPALQSRKLLEKTLETDQVVMMWKNKHRLPQPHAMRYPAPGEQGFLR